MVHSPPGSVVMAAVIRGAGPSHAVAGVALHLIPDRATGDRRQVSQRAIAGLVGPLDQSFEFGHLFVMLKQAAHPLAGEGQPPQADVVAAALDEHR